MRVLIIEDEQRLATTLAKGLRRHGFAVDVAFDGDSGLEKGMVSDYDVIVLDRNLPVRHGDDVCQRLRADGCRAGILMLTASGTIEDRVAGLALGADDYLPKPFAFAELLARVHALSRRAAPSAPPVLERGDIRVDFAAASATRGGRDLGLTNKELGVLHVLLQAAGRVVSAEELLDRVWDENADPTSNVVRVTLSTLRRKLGDPPVVETVIGRGYRL